MVKFLQYFSKVLITTFLFLLFSSTTTHCSSDRQKASKAQRLIILGNYAPEQNDDRDLLFGVGKVREPKPENGNVPGQEIALPSLPATSRAIDRFDTNLDRFASGPSPHSPTTARVILPANFMEQLGNRILPSQSTERKVERISSTTRQEANNKKQSVQKEEVRFLTNSNIPPPPSPTKPAQQISTIPQTNNKNVNAAVQGKVANPEIPQISRGEDARPAEKAERLGQQGKYAGPTNQYREDLGRKFTRKDGRERFALSGDGPDRFGKTPANKHITGTEINPPPEGTKINIDEMKAKAVNENGNNGEGEKWENREEEYLEWENGRRSGEVRPYLKAAEEITGSRWRQIDEHFNALNNGNRGRGPNRYVKIDLLNE